MTRKQVGLTLVAMVVLAGLIFFLPRLFTRNADLRSRVAAPLNLPKDQAADFFITVPCFELVHRFGVVDRHIE